MNPLACLTCRSPNWSKCISNALHTSLTSTGQLPAHTLMDREYESLKTTYKHKQKAGVNLGLTESTQTSAFSGHKPREIKQ